MDKIILVSVFVAWLHEQLGQMYVWGGNGETMTNALIRRMEGDTGGTHMQDALAFYAGLVAAGKNPILGYDCSGLISRFLQNNGIVSKKRNCNHLAAMCTTVAPQKRTTATDALLQPGDMLFRWSTKSKYYHVGVHAGGGMVIEAKGRTAGVVKRKINASSTNYWTHWGRLPYFTQEDKKPMKFEVTSPYQRGPAYEAMQTALNAAGYDCGKADGIWGPKSQAAHDAMVLAHSPALPDGVTVTIEVGGVTYRGDAIK